jgi:Flp pilus assembly protein TadG
MRTSQAQISRALRMAHGVAGRWRDKSGNVAIITALLMPVLMAVVGFAMDYGYIAYVKLKLDKAAEAAVIAAVSQSAATAGGGYSNVSWLQSYGSDIFSGNIAQLSLAAGVVTSNLTVTSTGTNAVTATVTYSATVPALFSGVIGLPSFTVGGNASANATGIVYYNYYILVDNSQSMGIGATSSDMTVLYNRVVANHNGSAGEAGCVFGCHVITGTQSYSNEYLAHNISPPVTLRIDAAVSAIQDIINAAQAVAGNNNNINIGLYTMSDYPSTGSLITTISPPTSNFGSLRTLASNITLGNNTSAGYGDSDFHDQLTNFKAMIPSNGSGASATSPQNYIFIITDGMVDTYGPTNASCTWAHCMAAFSSSDCTGLKSNATAVGVIYTTYLPIWANNNPSGNTLEYQYATLASNYVADIPGNLASCASSPGYYYKADDGPAITTGMEKLFKESQSAATLTH